MTETGKRRCVFCGYEGKLDKEHVVAEWVGEELAVAVGKVSTDALGPSENWKPNGEMTCTRRGLEPSARTAIKAG